MNVDARILFLDGERAARAGDRAAARACFVEAAQAAVEVQLWRSALRCFRHALELDLFDREVVERVAALPPRAIAGRGWDRYRAALEGPPRWPPFGCRGAQVVIGDLGATVECPPIGPVAELMMTERDLVEVRPEARYAGMPVAMAMIVLRRAMWPAPRERAPEPMALRVVFDGRERLRLDEHGDWEPLAAEPERPRG